MNGERYTRFSIAVEHMAKTLHRYKNEHLAAYGLRSMHLMFLFSLSQAAEGLTATELTECCSVDKAFISRVTAEMCSAGYVEYKTKDSAARYNRKLTLTEKGQAVMHEVEGIIDRTIASVTSGLSEEQLENFYTVMDHIDTRLCALSLFEMNEKRKEERNPCTDEAEI